MTDDDSEEDIEREEKFYLEEKLDSKEKNAHAEESEKWKHVWENKGNSSSQL